MAKTKKDFTAVAADVFVDKMTARHNTPTNTTTEAPRRQQELPKRQPTTNAAGTEVKVCYMVDATIEKKLRYIAYSERCRQKDVVAAAFRAYIEDYEATNGEID